MHLKIHKSYRNVISLADKELIGKKFEEGKFQLNVRENFYSGEELTKEEAVLILKKQVHEDATFNLVGPKSISTALEAGIITEEHIGKIDNIPFALTLL
ncbi:hypothetical protein CMI45_00945 [Candidatus Pacearchaeota archaeon]|nr:hypothetical protein [Candidatus Pacearchaeota archaeon]|tara:strand:- start:870 stop:1166 length:297 start_codon:yes stop_codon:yes gene_type:complete